jgi:transcriptional regulator with XRE-family HTH domain
MDDFLPVAEQLHILFETVKHPEGRPYTMQEVSEVIDVSLPTLSQLRTGRIRNPQLHTLREICRFFQVPLRYFETRSAEQCYAILAGEQAEEISPIHEIAFRATHLSPKSQQDVLTIIKWVQAAEEQRKNGSSLPPLPGLESYDEE